jgi:hypothetical protein
MIPILQSAFVFFSSLPQNSHQSLFFICQIKKAAVTVYGGNSLLFENRVFPSSFEEKDETTF